MPLGRIKVKINNVGMDQNQTRARVGVKIEGCLFKITPSETQYKYEGHIVYKACFGII